MRVAQPWLSAPSVRAHPVRSLPPDLAGIRAGKLDHLTFPCRAQWFVRGGLSRISCDTCLPLRGQHTRTLTEFHVSRLTAHLDRRAGTKTRSLYGFVRRRSWGRGLVLQYQRGAVGDLMRMAGGLQRHLGGRQASMEG